MKGNGRQSIDLEKKYYWKEKISQGLHANTAALPSLLLPAQPERGQD